MSPIIPSRYGHPKYNILPQKTRATTLGGIKGIGTRRKQKVEESKIVVQPKEDEEADNFFSKQLAAARFQRNHRLINLLFSEVVVDQDSNNDRVQAGIASMQAKRIKSLEELKEKIDNDITQINELFNIRKTRLIEDSKRFEKDMNNSKNELEILRASQRIRQEARKVLDNLLDSVVRDSESCR